MKTGAPPGRQLAERGARRHTSTMKMVLLNPEKGTVRRFSEPTYWDSIGTKFLTIRKFSPHILFSIRTGVDATRQSDGNLSMVSRLAVVDTAEQ
jgi:hypothetical protein